MSTPTMRSLAFLALVALACGPAVVMATDEACAGVTRKCTRDQTYEKTIDGSTYSCYDCRQALCKDGGNGGISGTATSSVCTVKNTTFRPMSLDDQARGADTLAPTATTSRRPVRSPTPRSSSSEATTSFDEADAIFGTRLLASDADQESRRDHRTRSTPTVRDHRTTTGRNNTMVESRPGTSPVSDERSRRAGNLETNPVAVAPDSTTVAVPLTAAECKKLGGRVAPVSLCKTFGNAACITTDQSGAAHAVCIGKVVEVAETPSGDDPIVSPNNRFDLPAPDGNMVAAPLTIQECKGLGGTEISTNKCSALDQKACATVDAHGVIRVACIDKVAN